MSEDELLKVFMQFGLAGILGFLLGLERQHSAGTHQATLGIRDFTLLSLIGATSAFIANFYNNVWLLVAAFFGFLAILVSGYWANSSEDKGFTTEIGAIMTFFLGVLVFRDASEIAVALAIVTLGIFHQRKALSTFTAQIKNVEIQAIFKFLIITFIILPILPKETLDTYITHTVGYVTSVNGDNLNLDVKLKSGQHIKDQESLFVFTKKGKFLGKAQVSEITPEKLTALYQGKDFAKIETDAQIRQEFSVEFLNIMLSALKPYKIWLIVVLVSFVSFVGYILIKIIGGGAGIGLTGLIGGLVSSTVTTLSFSKRSKENPEMAELFAVAVILAGSIMFPRLLLEVAVVNVDLAKNMAIPILVMGTVGLALSGFYFARSGKSEKPTESVSFDNPFNLQSAISFAAIFAVILMATRLATYYLGSAWLPVVALVSGLTDADAIAFSISDAQQAGAITLDWASFNLVLGALSNTFMKLFLVFSLGDRGMFKKLLLSFIIIGVSGIITMVLYYDFSSIGI